MSNKKATKADQSTEQQALEQRVDAMLSTESKASATPGSPEVTAPVDALAQKTSSLHIVSDYASNPTTAPKLPSKLRKDVAVSKTGAKPAKVSPPPESTSVAIDETPPKPNVSAPVAEPVESISEPAVAATSTTPPKSIVEDAETDKAVQDIVIHEGDTQLAVDDAFARQKAAEAEAIGRHGFLHRFFTSFWTWLFIVGIAGVVWAWYH
jgi:hypothetical protein